MFGKILKGKLIIPARPISYFRFVFLLLGLQIFTAAQDVEVRIAFDSADAKAHVSGRFADDFRPSNPRNVVFKREVAGNGRLAERVSDLKLSAAATVNYRTLTAGEYLAESDFRGWDYAVDLKPAGHVSTAHASWLSQGRAALMLDDLLPQFGRNVTARLKLDLPSGWKIDGAYHSSTTLDIDDLERAVIFIGRDVRTIGLPEASRPLDLTIAGKWHFTEREAVDMITQIFEEYSKTIGQLPDRRYRVAILPFPQNVPHGTWQAETRGRNVTIMSSDMPFRTQSLQRLHEQLRHEIFHLWFPNGIDLAGDYAWFYEGFAMYSSLKLAVKLNRIRFDDLLDTLARAHAIDANTNTRRPLLDPAVDQTVRYARGMIVAFLLDIALLRSSGGSEDVSRALRTLFARSRPPRGEPASEAIKTVFAADTSIYRRFVENSELVDWDRRLADAGIEVRPDGRNTKLAAATKLNGRQKAILDRLGYNNWRRLGTRK